MDEIWERAVETALDGQTDSASTRSLTLDGAVKCVHGRLPPPDLLEKFQNLEHLSIANIGVSSLEQFPRLPNLQRLILSDNRIAGGLEHLVEAGLDSLRDLDLSNNRIQYVEDLAPLAQLKLVSLDLYECPVTRVKDYRSSVFGLINSLKYLDKMDAEENERPESDDEDEEDEDEEEDEDDPGNGEVDGEVEVEDRSLRMSNGHSSGVDEVLEVDEEESDADEEETETSRGRENGLHHHSNGFRLDPAGEEGDEEEEEEDGEENESGEEIDEEEGEDEDVVEVHEIEDSDEDDVEDDDEDEEDEVEEVDNEDVDLPEPASTGRLTSTEGEIDGHEQGEEDDEDDNGETGEELDVEEDEEEGDFEDEDEDDDEDDVEEEEEDYGAGYLVQPVRQVAEGGNLEPGNEEADGEEFEDEEEDDDDNLGEVQVLQQPSSSHSKRKRDDSGAEEEEDEDEDEYPRRSFVKKHP